MDTSYKSDSEDKIPIFKPYATFDYSNLPFVTVDFNDVAATDENFPAYLDELYSMNLKSNDQPMVLLIDMKNASYISSKYRIMNGNRIKKEEEHIKKYSIATALLTHNMIQNIILKGLFAITENPAPLKVFGKKEEAMKWLTEMLKVRKKRDSL